MVVGDKVCWDTVTGLKTGEVERFTEKGIVVRLDNGKIIIANENSLKNVS